MNPKPKEKTPDLRIRGKKDFSTTIQHKATGAAGGNTIKHAAEEANEEGLLIVIEITNPNMTPSKALAEIGRADGNLIKQGKGTLKGRVTVITAGGVGFY